MQNSDEQQFRPYEQRISPVASFTMRLAGFFLALVIILALFASWGNFLSEAATIIKIFVVLLLILATGTIAFLAIERVQVIRHAHRAELRESERHSVQLHLLQYRLRPNEQGNYEAPILNGTVMQLQPGNFSQYANVHTFNPHTTNHYARASETRVTEVETTVQAQIAAPAIPTLTQLLASGETRPHEPQSILGYSDGTARRGEWAQLHSFFVVGLSGSGKSSTVAYYCALAVMHGARILCIDPDADMEESISKRIAPLSFAFLSPVVSSPAGVGRVLDIAAKELKHPSQYPIVWVVDEFSSIMRNSEWAAVAPGLAIAIEDYAQRGRKRSRTCIVLGQISKATRTGGTELRDSMTATFIHRLPKKQAQLVIDTTTAAAAPTLANGEVMVLLQNSAEPYRMQIPLTTTDDMLTVKDMMLRRSDSVSQGVLTAFPERRKNDAPGGENGSRTTVNAPENETERVKALFASGMSKRAIIAEVWNVKPGGSPAWQAASQAYDCIINAVNVNELEQEQEQA